MDINNLEYAAGAQAYYDHTFRSVLEDHMTNLRTNPTTQVLQLDEQKVYQWVGDLFGLLRVMRVDPYLFWTVMRMNGMDSPTDLSQDYTSLLVPSGSAVRKIYDQHRTLAKTTI